MSLQVLGRIGAIILASICVKGGAVTVFPAERDAPLHNPHMGWGIVEYVGSGDPGEGYGRSRDEVRYPWYDNVQVLFTWAAIERSPGVYDWSGVDRVIDYWVSQGKAIHIIASTEWYNAREGFGGCPEWVYELGVPRWTGDDSGASYPDYTDPVYKKHLRQYLHEFADHFCDNPAIETIALRGYGAFGEWHSGYPYGTVGERIEALRGVFDIWYEAVGGRNWLTVSVSYEWMFPDGEGNAGVLPAGTSIYGHYQPTYRDYVERSIFEYALGHEMVGARRDGVGGAVFGRYDGRLLANFFQHWRKPIFCEPFGGYSAYTGPSVVGYAGTRPGDNFIENCIDEAMTHHANYLTMHWGTDFHKKHPDLVAKAQKLMGYRFALVEASWPDAVAAGSEFTLRQTWENRAMGRCYERYPLAIYLMEGDDVVWRGVDEGFDQRHFVSGKTYEIESTFRVPDDLGAGEYELRIAMVDESIEPTIALAMGGGDGEERYRLGEVTVESGPVKVVEGDYAFRIEAPEAMPDGYVWGGAGELLPHRTYMVSFEYRVTEDPEKDLHTDDPGFFSFYGEGGNGVRIGETRWFDKAGQPFASRTVLLPLRERKDYRLYWECVGGGDMDVRDVRIELLDRKDVIRVGSGGDRLGSLGEDVVLRGGATAGDIRRRPPNPLPVIVARRDRSQIEPPDDYYVFASTNPDSVKLEPDTVYTVWFDCAARPRLWQGDYLYLAVRSEELGEEGDRGFFMWTQRHTSNPVRRAYSFRTGDAEDYRLDWGIKNGGYCELSRIVITRRGR